LKACANFDKFTPGTNFKAWILKILRNVYLDAKKKQPPQSPEHSWDDLVEDKENLDSDYPTEIIDIENQKILYDLFSEEIAHSLQKLPKRQQICLLLCDVEGLTYQEIADILGCPVGTVRSSIYRGRMLFYSYVQDYARKIGFKEPKQ
jgi:RNA polymerase sigma-70 factor (ECF subfamily)